jgi:hypothetical protein
MQQHQLRLQQQQQPLSNTARQHHDGSQPLPTKSP